MPTDDKTTARPEGRDLNGQHGGNRSGDRDKDRESVKQNSQAAGKHPRRGKPAKPD
jgi:hypothetical protein